MKVPNLWFYFKKMYFLHSYYHFVKDNTVSITYVFLKLSGLILNIKSMCIGFLGFLKHVGSFIRFLDLSIFQNIFIGESSVHELKSPSEKTLSYLHDSISVLIANQSRCDSALLCLVLSEQLKIHFFFRKFFST